MVFSSPLFLFLFLPVILGLYYFSHERARNGLLFAASLFFYAWGEPIYILLMLYSIAMNYCFGILVEEHKQRRSGRWLLSTAIAVNLVLLFYAKYLGFFLQIIGNQIGGWSIGLPIPDKLPIGISFYTFHAISYLVDVYRRESIAQHNPLDLGLYFAFFPQLVAGPIIRYHDISDQFSKRQSSLDDFIYGAQRFTIGLAKKVLIANTCAQLADSIFATPTGELSINAAWLGMIAYSLQIYFDFSGYSDMAIGLARMFGFHFLDNFNYPYVANSIKDFWRRWHISLSRWFRDYLYIPLGGNRHNAGRTYVNLLIVFFVTGLWHGANWTFIFWGLFHGAFLIAERIGEQYLRFRIWSVLRHFYVMLVVMIGWVFFRANDIHHAFDYLHAMSGLQPASLAARQASVFLTLEARWILALAVLLAMPVYPWLCSRLSAMLPTDQTTLRGRISLSLKQMALSGAMGLLLLAVALKLAQQTYNPFIYFRF